MQRFFNHLLIALSAALLISIFACDHKCPIPEDPNACNSDGTCNKGFECIDNTCQCPEPGYVLSGYCAKIGGDGPAWKGVSSSCYCYDTLGFGISGQGANRSLGMAFVEGGLLGSASIGIKYFEMPGGDSIYVFQLPINCAQSGTIVKLIPEGFGKIKPNGDMVLRIVFHDGVTYEYVDECITTLKKVK